MDDMSEYMNQLNIASGEENLRGAAEGAAASAASAANLASGKLESISTGIGTPIGIAFLSSAAKSVAAVGGQTVANAAGVGGAYSAVANAASAAGSAVSSAANTVGQAVGLTSSNPAIVADAGDDALDTATAASTAGDWNPVGVAITAVLGIASIFAGIFSHSGTTTARHVSVPVSNSSTQFGV